MVDRQAAVAPPLAEIDFSSQSIQACPFPAYRTLHAEAPVFRDPSGQYQINAFEDLWQITQNSQLYSSEHPIYNGELRGPAGAECTRLLKEAGYPNAKGLINADAPVHRKHRSLVDRAFSPSRVKALQGHIRECVIMLLDQIEARARAGEVVDFMAEFAVLLPTYVICDVIGVSRSHAADVKRWSDAKVRIHDLGISAEQQLGFCHEIIEMYRFIEAEYEKAKIDPKANLLGDLARAEVDGEPISMPVMMSILSGIFVAGNETTTATLGSSLLQMLEIPGCEERLRADPAQIPLFIEETLRKESPLQVQFRRNVEEVTLSGVTIPKDSILGVRFGAGNRDPRRFAHPDTFDMDRPRARQHLAFGAGAHTCLGMVLARTELRIAWEELLQRFAGFTLVEEPVYLASYIAYGPRRIVLKLQSR